MKAQDVVLLSTADWDNPFWTNKQHVAVELASRGWRVLYIESVGLRRPGANPADFSRLLRRLRRLWTFPRAVRPNLWVWPPVVLPLHGHPWARVLNRFLLDSMTRFHLRRLNLRPELLWTYNPLTSRLLPLKSFKRVVYHCVDEIKAQPGMPAALLEDADRELTKAADIVFTTAPRLAETRLPVNSRTYNLGNVADYHHFASARSDALTVPDDLLSIPGPRIGFIGAISAYKIDFELLRAVAAAHRNWSLVLVGKVGEGDPSTDARRLLEAHNIHLLGPRSYQELPRYLKGFDVALLPNNLNVYTESMFPMKFFEYLAAGKPVVSVDLHALQDYRDVVYLARSFDEFCLGITQALSGECAPLKRRLAVAEKHTYKTRMDQMLRLLSDLP